MSLVATRPGPGEPRPYTFPAVRRVQVAGGEVVAAHMPGQYLATAALLLDAGGARETAGREGTATVLAKCLEEGTSVRDSAAFALALEGRVPSSPPRSTGTRSASACPYRRACCRGPSPCWRRRHGPRAWIRPMSRVCATTR